MSQKDFLGVNFLVCSFLICKMGAIIAVRAKECCEVQTSLRV